ncbi:protein PIP-1-like [Equus asinus]|uniref:Secreted seminal-vesicle Ly-6 protein 1-like n=2 Tax=Equus asinus TaxID=9793 RepID=A0A9L0JA31_EQUAS|nr:protein PIP-1-like [Equus asinus]
MGKHLLLPLVILSLLLGFLQALYCFHCDRVNASGVCVSGERFCETTATEQCYVKKVYEGTTVLFGYQGCRNLCFPFMGCSHKYTVELTCCNSSSFCNKF